jgi:hypothetical protein
VLQQIRRVSAHRVQPDDHRHAVLGSRTTRHMVELAHAGYLAARSLSLFRWRLAARHSQRRLRARTHVRLSAAPS